MKLLFCKHCTDIIKLTDFPRSCMCGKVSGYYTDNFNAEYRGDGIPIGIDNGMFGDAVRHYVNEGGIGVYNLKAYLIKKQSSTITRSGE